jgi:hypothetical protein
LRQSKRFPGKADHFRRAGTAYISLWKKRDAEFFRVVPSDVEIAGLNIRVTAEVGIVTAEVGMRYDGNNMALKLYLCAKAD